MGTLSCIDPDFRRIVQTAIDAYTTDGCRFADISKTQEFCEDMLRRITACRQPATCMKSDLSLEEHP